MDRRDFLKAGLALPGLGGYSVISGAEKPRSYLQDSPDMLIAHLTGKLNALAAKWDGERAKLKTTQDVEARNRFVRDKVREMTGPYPEKTPLGAVVVRTHQRKGYRIENVMYQSRPNFWVTGNLYVPDGPGPFPAILSPCGHYPLARMQPDYQFAYLNLVHSGFVVLGFDPVGQGERRQYWNPQTGKSDIDDPVFEHSMPGHLQLLMGENLTNYRIWDGMRGIDYLQARPDVDKTRIGCAGHSGGGTLTLFISVLDERVKCSVVNEGGTNHRWPINYAPWARVGPSDVEQNLFPGALHGADLCDLHCAIAPRPLLTLIENYHAGFLAAADHIRTRYRQLGAEDKFGTEEATDPHAWTVKLRLAASNWFSRWFYGKPGLTREPDFQAEAPETLYCTPSGSIREARQGDTVFSLVLKKQAVLPPKPATPADASEIRELLRFRKSAAPLDPRLLVSTQRKGYRIDKVEFVSEPGIFIPAWVFVPERRTSEGATLFVNDLGKEEDGLEFGLYENLAWKGRTVISVDVRGIGQTQPPHTQSLFGPQPFLHLFNVETAMTYMTWYMDESLFGMRVQDVVRSVDYAATVSQGPLRVVGQGAAAPWVLFAAALDSRIASVVAERGLLSYRTLAQADRYTHGASVLLKNVLLHFDLPQVAAALADRPLTLAGAVDAMGRTVPDARVRQAYQATADAYRKAGVADRLRITRRGDASIYL